MVRNRQNRCGTKVLFIALILSALLCVAVFFCGCTLIRIPHSLTLKDANAAYTAPIGEFDFGDVTVVVTYSDGSTEEIAVNESMLPATELAKLYKPGEQVLRIEYLDLSCELKVFVTRRSFPENVTLSDMTVTYDGLPHVLSVTGDIPEGTEILYPDGNSFVDAGTYHVSAVVRRDGYETVLPTATLTIEKAEYDLSGVLTNDSVYVYDGNPKRPLAGNIPSDLNVSYTFTDENGIVVEDPTDAGVYTETFSFECHDAANYLPIRDRTATLTILPAVYDLGGAEIHSETFTYDGAAKEAKLLLPAGLPEGVTYTYRTYTGAGLSARNYRTLSLDGLTPVGTVTDAGLYLAVVTFAGDAQNYEPMPEMRALITVKKQVIDLSGFEPASDFLPYDGEYHSVKLVGYVPDGVKVDVAYNGVSTDAVRRAGNYEVVFTFTPSDEKNYEVSEKTKTTALIIETVIGTVDFSAENIFFDPEAGASEPKYRLENVPEGMTVSLDFTDDDGETVAPEAMARGEVYNFTATFTYDDEDRQASTQILPYSDRVRLREKLVLTEEIRFPGKTVYFDGQEHTVTLEGTYPDDLISYTDNAKTDAGKYTAIATLNTTEYYVLTPSGPAKDDYTTVLLINQLFCNLSHLTFEPLTVTYDGEEHSVAVAGEVPFCVTVAYTNAKATNAGVYAAKAEFIYDERNVIVNVEKLETVLTIEKDFIDLSHLTFPPLTVTFDWQLHSVQLVGDLPETVTVSYTDNEKANAGTYTARATFLYDDANYEISADYMETQLVINKALIDVSSFGFDLTPQHYDYDGTKHVFDLDTSAVPDYLNVSIGDGQELVGRYEHAVLITNPNYVSASFYVTYYVDFTSANIRLSRYSWYNDETYEIDVGYRAEYTGVDNASYMTATVELCFLSFYDEGGTLTPKDSLAANTTYTWTVHLYYMNGEDANFNGTVTTLD